MDSIDRFERFIQGEQSNEIGQKIGSFLKDSRWTGRQKKIAVVLIALLAIGGPALAAALLFNQTLTPPGVIPANVLTQNCEPVPPTPSSVTEGTNGFVIWTCTATKSAIHVDKAGTVTPTITKGSEWTTTYIYKETAGGTGDPVTGSGCVSAGVTAGAKYALTSGTPVIFQPIDVGGWRYCSDFVTAPITMSVITYAWSQ